MSEQFLGGDGVSLRPRCSQGSHQQKLLKRGFDIFASVLGLGTLALPMLAVALWIKIDSPGPVFFRQVRVGRKGEHFRIHKFRTMQVDAERYGQLTIGLDARVTAVGRLLRKTKLDELPQLLDVLLGDMSLVGPRPEVPKYIVYYPDEVRKIVWSVRPGITDWASIRMLDENEILGRAENPERVYIEQVLPEKWAYYVQYVETQSLLNDLRILVVTLIRLLRR